MKGNELSSRSGGRRRMSCNSSRRYTSTHFRSVNDGLALQALLKGSTSPLTMVVVVMTERMGEEGEEVGKVG